MGGFPSLQKEVPMEDPGLILQKILPCFLISLSLKAGNGRRMRPWIDKWIGIALLIVSILIFITSRRESLSRL